MANYRNISMAFWTDSKVVEEFTPEDRYIYLYCMTNPHTNLCGCYEVSPKQIAYETGYNIDTVERLLKRLDAAHNVIRYNTSTKELLVLNWCRYNWSCSEKLDKPLLREIRAVKCDRFREYLAGHYNDRESVVEPYEYGVDTILPESTDAENPVPQELDIQRQATPPERKVRHKYGQYGWIRLTDEEYERLGSDIGPTELERCIAYIDEYAQANGNKNKWKDWNIVIRKCNREKWGMRGEQQPKAGSGNVFLDIARKEGIYEPRTDH